MRKLCAALLLVAFTSFVHASDQDDVTASIRQFIDGFNRGDAAAAGAACAEDMWIIDELPPYEWRGKDAFAKWGADYDADAKKRGVTEPAVTLKGFRHVRTEGDRAYVVASADYDYKLNGKPTKESGAALTVVLARSPAGWKITGWSWAKP